MRDAFIIISSILVFLSYLIYEWSIVVGKTKPHRTTRLVILIIASLGAASLFVAQDRVAFWLLLICSIQSAVVFLMSLKWGMGGWAKTDIACLLIALIGVATWKLTDNPALGLYASVLADFIGMVPALIKTYRLPHTEYWLSYVFDVSAAGFTLLAITDWGLVAFAYPLYIVLINLAMLVLIFRRSLLNTSPR